MLNSKRLKDREKEKPETKLQELWNKIYVSDWFGYIHKPYSEVCYFFKRLKKNYLFYKNVLKFDYDFDSHGLLLMIHYKLKAMYPVLENGYAIQEDKDMQALRIAIKLSKRLWEDNYEERTWNKIEAKYGKLKHRSVKLNDGSGCYQMITSYGGNENEEYLEKVWAEKRLMYEVLEKCRERDERNLYGILLKYRRSWWE